MKDYRCKDCCHWKAKPSWKDNAGCCIIRSDWVNVVKCYPDDVACEYFKLKK